MYEGCTTMGMPSLTHARIQKVFSRGGPTLTTFFVVAECSKRAILSTLIKLPFVYKTFILSIVEWPLKTGFTVFYLGRFLSIFLNVIIFCHALAERFLELKQALALIIGTWPSLAAKKCEKA